MSLIGVDLGNTSTRMSRFANYLRNLIPSNDVTVMEMAAKAVGILAVSSGAFAAEYVEFEMKRVLEWLTGDRNEGRRHAAVSITRPPDMSVHVTGPHSAVRNMSLCRYGSNCRSRGCELDSGPVPYFHGD